MSSAFDDQSLTFSCPECGKEITETVARLKGKAPICPHCGAIFENEEFRRGLAEADEQFKKLGRDLENLF